MTIEELSIITGKSVTTLKQQWMRTKLALEKKGIIINRIGSKNHFDYTIFFNKINKNEEDDDIDD